jgi:GntR family transcriptional repressor for pyruvate dehydrogenase complex
MTSSGDQQQPELTERSGVETAIAGLEDIIFGGLEPGAEVPSEAEMAGSFGVSRLTVREAVRALEARGLLETRKGRRSRVAVPNGMLVGDFFRTAVRRDPLALLELLEVRQALEVQSASLAARRASSSAIADMEMSIAAMRSAGEDTGAFHAADIRFHENVAAGSSNEMLVFLVEAMAEPLRASRERSLAGHIQRGGGVEDVIEQHEAILDAIKARSPRLAGLAMRRHLNSTGEDLRTSLPQTARSGAEP